MSNEYEDDAFTTARPGGAAADAGDLTDPTNPMTIAVAFYTAVTAEDGPHLEDLQFLCTPESWETWDFAAVRESIDDRGLATRADPPGTGEPDVRYAKIVTIGDGTVTVRATGDVMVPDSSIITLQFRPDADPPRWQVHAYGDYVLPEDLPALR